MRLMQSPIKRDESVLWETGIISLKPVLQRSDLAGVALGVGHGESVNLIFEKVAENLTETSLGVHVHVLLSFT